MYTYYKKTNQAGEVVQLLIADYINEPRNVAMWSTDEEYYFEVEKMQVITLEEYLAHHIRLKLGATCEPHKPYQHGDERGICRWELGDYPIPIEPFHSDESGISKKDELEEK